MSPTKPIKKTQSEISEKKARERIRSDNKQLSYEKAIKRINAKDFSHKVLKAAKHKESDSSKRPPDAKKMIEEIYFSIMNEKFRTKKELTNKLRKLEGKQN